MKKIKRGFLRIGKKIIKRKRGFTEKTRKKKAQKLIPHTFSKYIRNPIISPKAENEWEAWQTFNPGVVLLENNVHFLYRAIGGDGISRLGYAVSSDGFTIDERLSYPVYEYRTKHPVFNIYSFSSGGSFGGCEDPRLVRIDEEDKLYMTYTACHEGLRVALTSIKIENFLQKKWKWKSPKLISVAKEVHKNWVLFPEKIHGKFAILHNINGKDKNHIRVEYFDNLNTFYPAKQNFESPDPLSLPEVQIEWHYRMRGAGPPPIKTKYGWLLFYHAMDKHNPREYKVGVMLLDLSDPTKILCRSKKPVLEPGENYENVGFKAGVVYVSGAVVKDGKLFIYYGCADSNIGVAYADFDKFLEELNNGVKPKLKRKILKRKKK